VLLRLIKVEETSKADEDVEWSPPLLDALLVMLCSERDGTKVHPIRSVVVLLRCRFVLLEAETFETRGRDAVLLVLDTYSVSVFVAKDCGHSNDDIDCFLIPNSKRIDDVTLERKLRASRIFLFSSSQST
jgi:hypothetical protein